MAVDARGRRRKPRRAPLAVRRGAEAQPGGPGRRVDGRHVCAGALLPERHAVQRSLRWLMPVHGRVRRRGRRRHLRAWCVRGRPGTGDRLCHADPRRRAFVRHDRGCGRPISFRTGDDEQLPRRAPARKRFAADAQDGRRLAGLHPPGVPCCGAGAGDGGASPAEDVAMKALVIGVLAAILSILMTATVVLGYRNEQQTIDRFMGTGIAAKVDVWGNPPAYVLIEKAGTGVESRTPLSKDGSLVARLLPGTYTLSLPGDSRSVTIDVSDGECK